MDHLYEGEFPIEYVPYGTLDSHSAPRGLSENPDSSRSWKIPRGGGKPTLFIL